MSAQHLVRVFEEMLRQGLASSEYVFLFATISNYEDNILRSLWMHKLDVNDSETIERRKEIMQYMKIVSCLLQHFIKLAK